MIHVLIRRATVCAVFVLAGAYAWMSLRGPQRIPSLLEKRREIRALEEHNANLKRDIANKQKLIYDLQYNRDKQDEVIRKWLHAGKPNEIHFILPDHEGAPAAVSPHADPEPRAQ
ncbi:MAG TPA: septum formation initiator family protein [Bryobacteraceae bacterium]|nr:septum formation initiator family protein [Bryobacteraceae bacterium]